MTPRVQRIVQVASVVLIAIVAVVNVVQAVRRTPPQPRVPAVVTPPVAMRQEARLARVRDALRARGVTSPLGYIGDLPVADWPADYHGMEDYTLGQFALAPWVLDAHAERCTWAVANLRTGDPARRVPATFRVVVDFGGGLLLLKKATP
ncbi:MAG TPA: hypothetical protein VM029_09930 [Opitutaceae bacterium]|nr:hypothetical protein [Opitutaceae bacterium]